MSEGMNKIGIILGSTREGRVSESVGKWLLEQVAKQADALYEMVDLRSYPMPFLGEKGDLTAIGAWNQKIASLDGFIFITPEYNHSLPAVLKNALDLGDPKVWANKAAGIVSYGSAGGARSSEHLRGILSELQIAHVRTHVLLSLFHDFVDGSQFKPLDIHGKNIAAMTKQLNRWATALKPLRK